MSSRNSDVSHHIFCAGAYGLPFARLSARCIRLAAGISGFASPRLFIHCDALPRKQHGDMVEWLRDEPGVRVTYGWFGMRPNESQPVNWHQRMINITCKTLAAEPLVAIVDADLFLGDGRWFHLLEQASAPDVFALSWGIRENRTLKIEGATYEPMKTCLFTLRPALQLALNEQRNNTDSCALKKLRREFPGCEIDVGPGLDTQIAVSLRAQALGWRLVNVEPEISASHIGGFSHMDRDKLREGGSGVRIDRWLQRLRLMERVLDLFARLGWSGQIDEKLKVRVEEMRTLISGEPEMADRLASLKPNADERNFPKVVSLLGYAEN